MKTVDLRRPRELTSISVLLPGERCSCVLKMFNKLIDDHGIEKVIDYIFDKNEPSLTGDKIALASQSDKIDTHAKREIIVRGLKGTLETRSATIDAIESWETDWEIIQILRSHREPVKWLEENIEKIVKNYEQINQAGLAQESHENN